MAYTTINKPTAHFNTKLYTGNAGTQSITGVGFQPDMVWLKKRSASGSHYITDAVRGVNKVIFPDETNAEYTYSDGVSAFNSDGWTVGNNGGMNGSGATQVGWNWKAGNSSGSANTDGTITSTVSANTTAGFSIATWSGTGSNGSIGHGLGGVDCMIIKNTNSARDFYFWNKSMVYNTRLELNNNEAFTTGTDNMTALPDATKINMATSTQNNGSSQNYVGYFFQEKQGYSKFGNYTGNANADGPFIYTGFKPALVIIKQSSGGNDWWIYDNKRDTFNLATHGLRPSKSNAEVNYSATDTMNLDLLSNGFKIKSTDGALNGNGSSYIYMSFAEAPLVGTNNVPCTAR